MQAVKNLAFVIEFALGAVEVLRGRLLVFLHRSRRREGAAAKRNDLTVHISDGEHQAMAEAVVVAATRATRDDEPHRFGVGR